MPKNYYSMHVLVALIIERFSHPSLTGMIKKVIIFPRIEVQAYPGF